MKKLAVLTSENETIVRAVIEYFRNKNIDIIVLSNVLNSKVFDSAKLLNIEYEYVPAEENGQYFSCKNFDLVAITEYKGELSADTIESGKFIDIHMSLLPAFKGKDAIYRAFDAGVKVSGVTVHSITSEIDGGKILAQYPVLISNTTHFDEFRDEMYKVAGILYPKVIECILEDKVFDFADLFKGACSSGCGGCSGDCRNH